MDNNNNGMDSAFREAASNYKIPLSREEKGAIWMAIRKRSKRPVFWAWMGAGGAVLLLGAFLLYQMPPGSFSQGELPEEVVSESADVLKKSQSEQELEYPGDQHTDEAVSLSGTDDVAADEITADDIPARDRGASESPVKADREEAEFEREIESVDGAVSTADANEETHSAIAEGATQESAWVDELNLLSDGWSEFVSGTTVKGEEAGTLPGILEDDFSDRIPHSDFIYGKPTPLKLSDLALHALTEFNWEEFSSLQTGDESIAGSGFIDLYFNADIVSNRFRATSPAGQRLKDGYRDYTGPWFSFSTGAMTNLKTLGNFSLLAGLEYQRITREFDFRSHGVEFNMKYSPEAYYFIDDSGEVVWVDGAVLTAVRTEQRLRAPNVHEFVRIPVLVEYMKEYNNLKLGLSLGIAVNIFENHSGYIMVDGDQFRSFESGDFERRWFSDVRANLLAGYNLTDQWTIYGRAGYQHHAGDWLSTGQDLEMSVTVLSLGMGVRRSF